jgi:hypothetical protein
MHTDSLSGFSKTYYRLAAAPFVSFHETVSLGQILSLHSANNTSCMLNTGQTAQQAMFAMEHALVLCNRPATA